MKHRFENFAKSFDGEFYTNLLHRSIYATDASVYRKIPMAVAIPRNNESIKALIRFASENQISLIPRAAGTSLAGQCVGDGIVVDISKYFTEILSINTNDKTVKVQPGVIRDELNAFLQPYNLFFSPNTSTTNRCTLGGMVGNNSSGTTSIQYGVTRDKVVKLKAILANGEEVIFESLSKEVFINKTKLNSLEGKIYKTLYDELRLTEVQDEIRKEFPNPEIHRRNTGYAVDELLKTSVFGDFDQDFNMCKLICGSEGTLAFITEITLQLDTLPPQHTAMIATHYKSISDCLNDVNQVMRHNLFTCEMMDKIILDCTKHNKSYQPYRFFIKDEPQAILLLELKSDSDENLQKQIIDLLSSINSSGLSYHHPVLRDKQIEMALDLRKAGLGLLGNMIGDAKAVACIEDTAVALKELPLYIEEFSALMKKFKQEAVYYAHAGAGELHLRPILNLKKSSDVQLFRNITYEVAELCKKYKGSFSGEHGDGIVRAEFIPLMIGVKNYELLKRIKAAFDAQNIFNPGKIVNSFKMDESLRYQPDRKEPEVSTMMDFNDYQGIHRLAENCNGSGDCRKTEHAKGAMCPSFHATRNEKDTTRARANMLREVLTTNTKPNKFDSEELKKVFDLCLSCKACASECPSNVDIAAAKTEFLYQYHKEHPPILKVKIIANSTKLYRWAAYNSGISNFFFKHQFFSSIVKRISGIHPKRSLPLIARSSFQKRNKKKILPERNNTNPKQKILLFVDEFSNYLDTDIASDALELLQQLGYEVETIVGFDSARTLISKGFLQEAKKEIDRNIAELKSKISNETPLVGIEPSAILSFRDEYLRLASDKEAAKYIAENTYLIEEFLAAEMEKNRIDRNMFSKEVKTIKIHIHCHQKSLSNSKVTFDILNFPENFVPTIIPSGCCGMAGSFGYEKNHYDLSMKIGELVLFPIIRKSKNDVLIASNGTSCRHQILDGTGQRALHPVTILRNALLN